MRVEDRAEANAGQRRSLVVAALGTIIEWYDFGLYLYLAPIYARVFFPSGDQIDSLIVTFGVFAVAYLARPAGAIVFGRYGDRSGRQRALVVSAAIVAVSLLANGLLPSEATIGAAAPIILLLTRLTSGFAIGAEYSGIFPTCWRPAVAATAASSPAWRRRRRGSGPCSPSRSRASSPGR